jgi:hypothetical protein
MYLSKFLALPLLAVIIGGAVFMSPLTRAQQSSPTALMLDTLGQPIEWIDAEILAKLQAIKPQKNYTIQDVQSILPKNGNFISWVEGDVKKVYASTTNAALDTVYGVNAVRDSSLKGDEKVIVIESVSNVRTIIPTYPGGPLNYAKGQLMSTIVNSATGNVISMKQTYLREKPLALN